MSQTFTTLASLLALGLRDDLKGPRSRGSLTEIGLESLDGEKAVTEFRPEIGAVPVARYFRVDAPELQGRLGAVPMGDLTREQLSLLRTRDAGKHGIEFFLDVPADGADLPSVSHATIIVGPINEEGDLGFWTWFPGDVAGTAMAQDKVLDTPLNTLGVKLHNG
jgi:hypothetical protein